MNNKASAHLTLTNKIAGQFKIIPGVEAIALGGSATNRSLDQHSDIDLYVYTTEPVPLASRQAIVDRLGASEANLNLTFWDPGDQWFDLETGIEVDMIYWDCAWIEGQLESILGNHQASMGYSTCFWFTVLNSQILFDPEGWFAQLQEKSNQPYPAALRKAIIEKNHPVLKAAIPSYYGQIKKALTRGDLISLNHRLAAFFASYFDLLFALNEVLHPGEKKIMPYVLDQCTKVPPDLQQRVETSLKLAAAGEAGLLGQLDLLLAGIENLMAQDGIGPNNI